MRFYKLKIRTAITADKVKVGSFGYFADTLAGLKEAVESETNACFGRISKIHEASKVCRFVAYIRGHELSWTLFYPVKGKHIKE